MALLAYLVYAFTTFIGLVLIHLIYFKEKRKRVGSSPSVHVNATQKALPLERKSKWKLIDVKHGLRVWKKSEHHNGFLLASSTILPVSLKAMKEVLIDPMLIPEWNPMVQSVSSVNMSPRKDKDSSECGVDMISVIELSNPSTKFLRNIGIFGQGGKLYSRTWQYEEHTQFWLHSAVVDPKSQDALYTLFLVYPLKGNTEECEVIISCDVPSLHHGCNLACSLAGIGDLVVHKKSEVVLPELKSSNKNEEGVRAAATDDMVDEGNNDEDDEKTSYKSTSVPNHVQDLALDSEDFVDITGVYYNLSKDTQRYKRVVENAVKGIMECYNAKQDENGWCFVGKIKDVEVLKKPASPGFSAWDCSKGTIVINVPLYYILAYVGDLEHTGEYDDMFEKGHVVENVGDLTNVKYLEYKGIWPVSGRDFCIVDAIRILQDNTYVIAGKHIKHPACPPCKKYVRGKILCGGFVLKVLSENPPQVETTYVTHVDLQGSVPSRIVNKVTAGQPLSVGLVKHFVEKMYKDELDHPDRTSNFKTNALNIKDKLAKVREAMAKTSRQESGDATPAQVTAKEQVSESGPAIHAANGDAPSARNGQSNQDQPPSRSSSTPSLKGALFDNGGLDYKTIGNQACAVLLQESFEIADVDIGKPASSVLEKWEYMGSEKSVLMYRKMHRNEKMHSFVGKGFVSCPPPRIWDVLRVPETALRYNNMLRETRTLEKLSDSQWIEYLHFETEKCFRKEARDFVALRTERREKDKYLLSAISVDYPKCAMKKDVRRGKIITSGWVVEPYLVDGQLHSMVTYLVQMNPGGSYPAVLVNWVGKKQSLCIAYLRKFLQNPNQSFEESGNTFPVQGRNK